MVRSNPDESVLKTIVEANTSKIGQKFAQKLGVSAIIVVFLLLKKLKSWTNKRHKKTKSMFFWNF